MLLDSEITLEWAVKKAEELGLAPQEEEETAQDFIDRVVSYYRSIALPA